MNAMTKATEHFFNDLPAWLRARRRWVWPALLVLVVALGFGIGRIQINMSMEANFMSDDPALDLYNQFKATFESDEAIYLVYEAKDGDVLSEASLRALARLHSDLNRQMTEHLDGPLGHLSEVTSLINASYLEARGDLLVSDDLVGEQLPQNRKQREALRDKVLAHPDFPGFLMSKDSRYGALLIKTDLGGERIGGGEAVEGFEESFSAEGFDLDTPQETSTQPEGPIRFKQVEMQDYAAVMAALTSVYDQAPYNEHLEFHPVGNAVLMAFFNDVLVPQLNLIFAGLLVLMLVMLWFLFRSISAMFWPVVVVLLANVAAVGLVGWVGLVQSMMLEVVSILILVIGVADSVHILSGYRFHRAQGLKHNEAMAETMRRVGPPCVLASFTTSLGMFALMLVPVQMIQNFGITAVIGIAFALIFSLVLLPLSMDIWQPLPKNRENLSHAPGLVNRFLDYMEPLVLHHPKTTLVIFALVAAVAGGGFTKIQVDSNMLEVIKDGYPIKDSFHLVDQHMGGSDNLEFFFKFGQKDAMKDPQVLAALDRLQTRLENDYEAVVTSSSLADVVKRSYQVLNEDQAAYYRIPEDRQTLAQVLLLFDQSNREDRLELVPDEYARGRLSLRMTNHGSEFYSDFLPQAEALAQEVFAPLKERYPELQIELTGSVALTMIMVDRFAWSQIKSFSLALGAVTLVMLLLFKSLKVGFMAMVPNLFPIVTTFGLMGYFGVPLDADTLIIAPIIIGIAVDDTIHFLSHYRREVRELGGDIDRAVLGSMREVGQALSFTSLILGLGFSTMIFLGHTGMSAFGALSSEAMAAALLADLLALPALVRLTKLNFNTQKA